MSSPPSATESEAEPHGAAAMVPMVPCARSRWWFGPAGLTPQVGFIEVFLDEDADRASDPGEDLGAAVPNAQSYAGMLGMLIEPVTILAAVTGAGTGPLGQPVAGDGVPFTNNRLAVLPDGTLSEAGVITMVGRSGQGYAITASVGGGVRLWAHDGTSWK